MFSTDNDKSSTYVILSIVIPILSAREISAQTDISVRFVSQIDALQQTDHVVLATDTALIDECDPSKVVPVDTTAITSAISFVRDSDARYYFRVDATPVKVDTAPVGFVDLSELHVVSPHTAL